jgi:hypothetical protein
MSYKSESTIKQTHTFPEQKIGRGDGVFTVKAKFSQKDLIELAQFKEYELVIEIPILPVNER